MRRKILKDAFFDRPTLTVARELVGKFLVRRIGSREIALMITETEAYHGWSDLASHARRGKTLRNAPMFAEAGTIYVYFTYGMHWMLNLVCGKKEFPAAVLIRAASETDENLFSSASEQVDRGRRAHIHGGRKTTPLQTRVCKGVVLNGPARLTKFAGIDKRLTGLKLGKKSGLWVEDRGVTIRPRHIGRTGRIGVDYSGEWAKKPWRFVYMMRGERRTTNDSVTKKNKKSEGYGPRS